MTAARAAHHRAGAALRLLATLTVLAAGETTLWFAGQSLPSLSPDPGQLTRILSETEPLALAAGLLRVVGLVAGAGLLATTTLGLLARGCDAARVVVRLDRWTPAAVRRLLDGAMGAGLAASIGLSTVPAGADPGGDPPPPGATLRRLPDAPTTTLRRLPQDGPPPAEAPGPPNTLRRLPDAPPAPPHPVAAPVPRPSGQAPRHGEVVVQPGDSFWLIAERREAERLGREPTEHEVGACWQELVAANRHRLAVPGNPDLLFPGQVVVLPCP